MARRRKWSGRGRGRVESTQSVSLGGNEECEFDVQNSTHRIEDHLQHRLGAKTRPDNVCNGLHGRVKRE